MESEILTDSFNDFGNILVPILDMAYSVCFIIVLHFTDKHTHTHTHTYPKSPLHVLNIFHTFYTLFNHPVRP